MKINVEEEPEVAQRLAVRGIPTLALNRRSGAALTAELVRWSALALHNNVGAALVSRSPI